MPRLHLQMHPRRLVCSRYENSQQKTTSFKEDWSPHVIQIKHVSFPLTFAAIIPLLLLLPWSSRDPHHKPSAVLLHNQFHRSAITFSGLDLQVLSIDRIHYHAFTISVDLIRGSFSLLTWRYILHLPLVDLMWDRTLIWSMCLNSIDLALCLFFFFFLDDMII